MRCSEGAKIEKFARFFFDILWHITGSEDQTEVSWSSSESSESWLFNGYYHFNSNYKIKSPLTIDCDDPLRRTKMCLFAPTSQSGGVYDPMGFGVLKTQQFTESWHKTYFFSFTK